MKAVINVGHLACGIGGGAKGFNGAKASVGSLHAKFECIGGIDVDPAAIRDFEKISGVKGTVLDLFTCEQYEKFHGHRPPPGWRQAAIADIHSAFGHRHPHILFASFPCKGFSGLLSEKRSQSNRYQALNELVLHGMMLACEAYKDDPVEFFLLENVPRIATRGRHLIEQISGLLRAYGYAVAETTHDCGELGGLAQSRKRFLLVARHIEKVPPFLYEPVKRPLRGVGEVLGRMLPPGDPLAGPMHRIPALQWKTWVRLAFVEAGKDWRSLQKLRVADGMLQDFALVPENDLFRTALGVKKWTEPSNTITGDARPGKGAFSVADPRFDPDYKSSQYGVNAWDEPAGVVTSQRSPGQGVFSVADPRINQSAEYSQLGVRRWDESTGAISGQSTVGGGAYAVADPRLDGVRHNNVFRVVRIDEPTPSVTAGTGPTSGGIAVADPRLQFTSFSAFGVTKWEEPSPVIAGESFPSNGRFAIADPRVGYSPNSHRNKFAIVGWHESSGTVTGSKQIQGGALSVADPRLPSADARLVAVIRSIDNTWHRPFTTLECAALQGLVSGEEYLELDGSSDSRWREAIGNMVPPPAAEAIGSCIAHALLLAWTGETFALGSTPIWVRDVAVAIAVKPAELPT